MTSGLSQEESRPVPVRTKGTFRRAVLRGAGVVMPPLLTLVLFIWAWNAIENYVLRPLETSVRYTIVWNIRKDFIDPPKESRWLNPETPSDGFIYQDQTYVHDGTGTRYLPVSVIEYVNANLDRLDPFQSLPITANAYWHRYVELRYLPRAVVVPVFLLVFLVVLYFLGRIFTHGLGRWTVQTFDAFVSRLPVVSNVYGSVKQVTDFVFSDREIEFNRVVAIEYPRKGIWSIGFVTGQGMGEIMTATGEPMLSVLMPTSPMPMTGFTVTIRKSEAIDLNITVDQAIQFVVSCGVVVPPHQLLVPSQHLPMSNPHVSAHEILSPLVGRDGAEGE